MRFLATFFLALSTSASALDFETEARLKMALQIAREHNDTDLVKEVTAAATAIKSSADAAKSESLLLEAESAVGIDPGGWSMAGQPLFHPSPDLAERLRPIGSRLEAALLSESPAEVAGVVAEWKSILGDQAGIPDGRRAGVNPVPIEMNESEATKLFLEALKSEGRAVKQLTRGVPLPDQMLRFYGYLLESLAAIRPSVQKHSPDDLAAIDALAAGAAEILTKLQQPAGHFPFPDLRGRNIRFGEMIDKRVAAGEVEVREGWVVTPDPDGGSQFDTGVCGVALLRAGSVFGEPAWSAAGLRAADWAMGQPCVTNFNYNAFSVSLLAAAHVTAPEVGYLDKALAKFQLGVAPGQSGNGRWIDSHNARTVYHIIILRAMGDLLTALPAERTGDITSVKAVAEPALEALLTEFAAMGITVECLPELLLLNPHFPDHTALESAIDRIAASLAGKSTDGSRIHMGAQPHQLAAVAAMLRGR